MTSSVYNVGDQWQWDDNENGLVLVGHTSPTKSGVTQHVSTAEANQSGNTTHADLNIKFCETVDTIEQIRFRRQLRRRVKPSDPDVVTIQDIKDVVIFQTCSQLPRDFIDLIHTQEVDIFFRALILYFQYFLQISTEMQERTEAYKLKLEYKAAQEIEATMHNDLADLRSIVAYFYGSMLLGIKGTAPFHHMANGYASAAEQEIRYMELLYRIAARVVWVALQRKNFNAIEMEINRMFRTDTFNVVLHQKQRGTAISYNSKESIVLHGEHRTTKNKFLCLSPVIRELLRDDQDFRLFCLDNMEYRTRDERILVLRDSCLMTEEIMEAEGVTVGILGMQRKDFDPMLSPVAKPEDEEEVAQVSYQEGTIVSKLALLESVVANAAQYQLPPHNPPKIPIKFLERQSELPDPHAKEREMSRIKWKNYVPRK